MAYQATAGACLVRSEGWMVMSELEYLLTVLTAFGLGGAVGLERELAGKPAGLRTHMLVAGSAALMVILGDAIISRFAASETDDLLRVDPIRIFEAILVGVSFLGAGTIIQRESSERVEGLTTAASLLFVAALGIAVALDLERLALILAVVLIFITRVLLLIERRLLGK